MNSKKVNKSRLPSTQLKLTLLASSRAREFISIRVKADAIVFAKFQQRSKRRKSPESLKKRGLGTGQEQELKSELSSYLCLSNDSTKTCARFEDGSLELFLSCFSISKHNKSRNPLKKKKDFGRWTSFHSWGRRGNNKKNVEKKNNLQLHRNDLKLKLKPKLKVFFSFLRYWMLGRFWGFFFFFLLLLAPIT